MEILDKVSKQEGVRHSSLSRLPQTAVKVWARIEEIWQNQAHPRVHKAPMRIPTTSGPTGALHELLQQSQAPPRVQEAPMRTPTPSSPRVMVPTPVRQSILTVQNAPPSILPIASKTRAAQATAMNLSQGPASNIRSQSNYALERALHAATFLDKKSVNARRLASRKFLPVIFATALAVMYIDSGKCSNIDNLPITKIRISAEPGTHQQPTKLALYFRAWGKESKTLPTPAISSERNKSH